MGKSKGSVGVILCLLLWLSVGGQSLDLKRTCVVNTALSEVGTLEATGNNDGERVGMYILSTGIPPQTHVPWCAAFVNWCLGECGINPNLTYPAFSPSYFSQEKIVWSRDGRHNGPVRPGDLAGFYYANLNRIGHIGIIIEVHSTYFVTCEGNTNSGGSRDGDGVYLRKRLKKQVKYVSNWIDEI